MVDFPTRKENTLDIIFTNRPSLVHKLTQCPGISDHNTIVQAEIDCRARVHKPVKRKVHLWHKLSPEMTSLLKDHVRSKSEMISQNFCVDSPVEDIWSQIKIISAEVLDKLVPSKITSSHFTHPG